MWNYAEQGALLFGTVIRWPMWCAALMGAEQRQRLWTGRHGTAWGLLVDSQASETMKDFPVRNRATLFPVTEPMLSGQGCGVWL